MASTKPVLFSILLIGTLISSSVAQLGSSTLLTSANNPDTVAAPVPKQPAPETRIWTINDTELETRPTMAPLPTTTRSSSTPACPKTPDALLLIKRCRFFTEIMGVQPRSAASAVAATAPQVYPPRSLIVAVTVFCKVPEAETTFTDCVDETFQSTTCSQAVKQQLHLLSADYWSRYCINVDDNIQTLKYLFSKVPVHLVDEEWEVGSLNQAQQNLPAAVANPNSSAPLGPSQTSTGLCVTADDLQDLVINPCARWYNRVIGTGSRDRPLDVYLNVASTSSDIGLQCVKRRMLRSTNCGADLIYLMLRALYVFQGLPGVSIPLVYLDPSFKRQNPTPSGQCPARSVVSIWSNQFVQSVNRGVRYCPLTSGATDLLTTDTVEIVGILNVDQGVTSVDIRFFNPTNQHDPLVWYKASQGQLPTTFTSAVSRQSTITIEPVTGSNIPSDTQVVKITDAGVGQMSIIVAVRARQYYDIIVSATDFDMSYATGVLVWSCSRTEDIDYKSEVVNLESASLTGQFADECEDACRAITTVGYHESCLIACMRRGGDSRIVNTINMLLGYSAEYARICNITQHAPPVIVTGAAGVTSVSSAALFVGLVVAKLLH